MGELLESLSRKECLIVGGIIGIGFSFIFFMFVLVVVSTPKHSNTSVEDTKPKISVEGSATPKSVDVEQGITERRYAECLRQRRAMGLDTSPCAEWAKER